MYNFWLGHSSALPVLSSVMKGYSESSWFEKQTWKLMQSDLRAMSEEIIDTLDWCSELWNHVYISQRPWLKKKKKWIIRLSNTFFFFGVVLYSHPWLLQSTNSFLKCGSFLVPAAHGHFRWPLTPYIAQQQHNRRERTESCETSLRCWWVQYISGLSSAQNLPLVAREFPMHLLGQTMSRPAFVVASRIVLGRSV